MPRSGYKSMNSAPRDGTEIIVLARGREHRCWYVDCTWLRQPFKVDGEIVDHGDPDVSDVWRSYDGDIELADAQGWRAVEVK